MSPREVTTNYPILSSTNGFTIGFFNLAYFSFFFICSIPSTAAVVYTVPCIYTARDITFNKVMSVVPKITKRLLVTDSSFPCPVYLSHCSYICLICSGNFKYTNPAFSILVILFIVGFLDLITCIVTVLEKGYGFSAMVKSKNLMEGKLSLAIPIFVILNLAMWLHHIAFQSLVVEGTSLDMANRVVYAIICFSLLSTTVLFGLVVQTVIYFVCKSYHHENMDKSALSEHLFTS